MGASGRAPEACRTEEVNVRSVVGVGDVASDNGRVGRDEPASKRRGPSGDGMAACFVKVARCDAIGVAARSGRNSWEVREKCSAASPLLEYLLTLTVLATTPARFWLHLENLGSDSC